MSNGFKLLTPSGNPKTEKGRAKGYWTFILHFAPARLSGFEVCAARTPSCTFFCLNVSGHGMIASGGLLTHDDIASGKRTNHVQLARLRRTLMFYHERAAFMALLVKEIIRAIAMAKKSGFIAVFRLNGTSDIRWEGVACEVDGIKYRNLMEAFPSTQFYDYTKLQNRKNVPANYHLTFSLAENNEEAARKALSNGCNVAVVFRDKPTVARYMQSGTYLDAPVINGDIDDLRFLDGRGNIVALYAKGHAKHDTSGFVKD